MENSGGIIEFKDYLSDVYRVLKDGTHCYIMVNHFNLLSLLEEAKKVGFKFMKCLIWVKSAVIYTNYYMNAFEYIVFFRKGKDRRINNKETKDVLNVPFTKTKENGENIHPTEKPVELMEILIENSSNVGETVLDCFMGSGTTGVACKKLNRHFIGCEIDEKYFNMAEKRINNVVKDICYEQKNLFEEVEKEKTEE